jgi:hypothetical protein
MNYKISDLYLNDKDVTLNITTPNSKAFLDFPEIMKGVGKNSNDDLLIDKICKKIFANSDMAENGLTAEHLLELTEQDIKELFQQYVFGEFQGIEVIEISKHLKEIHFKNLSGVEYRINAKLVSALITRKYRDLVKGISSDKPSQKDIELFLIGIVRSIIECSKDINITEEDLLNEFSIFTILSIYGELSKTNFTPAVTTAS